jgi:alpha/beta superfamily hydrolase
LRRTQTKAEEDVSVEVPGGPTLEGRLALIESARGGLVVCHPHPLYGGDMENPVVLRAAEVGQETGLSTLRFNFRGVGRSTGAHAQGEGEQDDLEAALAMLQSHLPPGRPLSLAGYSFGAWVAARVAGRTLPLAGLCLIAPPLAMFDFETPDGLDMETLLVAGTRDAYCRPDDLDRLAQRLPAARTLRIEGADHFFFGKLFPLGEAIRGWARRWAAG